MISRARIKFLKSLQQKKYRTLHQLFLVEGKKSVLELLDSTLDIYSLIATESFIEKHKSVLTCNWPLELATEKELEDIGSFASNDEAIALVGIKPTPEPKLEQGEYTIMLDQINDPGNLGTIIRVADWYGIKNVIASANSAELYNPKVIAASKGSFSRVNVYYTNLEQYIQKVQKKVYAARLEGESIYHTSFSKEGGIILMGSESHGLSKELYPMVDEFVFIPRLGRAESLNVAVATAIFCDRALGMTTQI